MLFARGMTTLAMVISLSVVAQADDKPGMTLPAKEKFHLYVLAGQSNMAGRGKIGPEDKQPHPRVVTLAKDGRWKPAADPLHFDKPIAGVGLGRSFAFELVKKDPTIVIGLVPVAAGGSPIASWEPGGYHGQTKSHPYDDAIKRVKSAMEVGVLKGILWHQGESDSKPELAEVYEEKLTALLVRFRNDLKAPKVPFIIGQLGQFPDKPWNASRTKVDAAHQAVAKKVPLTTFVSSKGLTAMSDNVHFDSKSLREFGRRYAKAYLELMNGK